MRIKVAFLSAFSIRSDGTLLRYAQLVGTTGRQDQPAGIGRLGNGVAVLFQDSSGALQVGVWPVSGGEATEPLRVVPSLHRSRWRRGDIGLRNVLSILVLLLLLAYVFWRRQDVIARPLSLPEGYAVASLWRRAGGFAIDASGIGMVTSWWWGPTSLERWLAAYRMRRP